MHLSNLIKLLRKLGQFNYDFANNNSKRIELVEHWGDHQRTKKWNSDLWLWNNLDSHILALQAPLLGLGRASIPKMPTPHFIAKLIMSYKLFREPEILIQGNVTLTSFRDWGFIGLNRAMPASKQCPNVFRRRGRRERSLKNAQRRRTHAGVGRGVLEETWQWTWAVKGKVWGFGGVGIECIRLTFTGNCGILRLGFWVFCGFSMTESHESQTQQTEEKVYLQELTMKITQLTKYDEWKKKKQWIFRQLGRWKWD